MSTDNRSWGSLEIKKNREGSVSKWVLLDWLKIALFLDNMFNIVWTLLNMMKVLIITENCLTEMLLGMWFLFFFFFLVILLYKVPFIHRFFHEIRGHTIRSAYGSCDDHMRGIEDYWRLLEVQGSACLWLQSAIKFKATVWRARKNLTQVLYFY